MPGGGGDNSDNFEFRRAADRLVNSRGVATVDYVKVKIETMKEQGDEGKQVYWGKILKETERLLFG